MKYGTHNSATYTNVIWWQYPFKWLSNLTSKCQSLTIKEQYDSDVRVFNFQVTYYKNEWYISHGLFVYNIKLLDILKDLKTYASDDDKIYYQLYLDNNFLIKHDIENFKVLLSLIKAKYVDDNLKLLSCWDERDNVFLYKYERCLKIKEYYWTKQWSKRNSKSWIDKLPLPKRWAKKYNNNVKINNEDYLMLDFIETYDRRNNIKTDR